VVVVPGMGESAEEYAWLIDAPESGYRWEDHISDIGAVIAMLELDRPVLVAFSRGSSYALGYALSAPDEVRGLVIGDYQARHIGLPPEFAERQLAVVLRGVPMSERMPRHAVIGVAEESREVPLWDRLRELRCPVLLIRGGRRGVIVDDEAAARWQAALPGVEIAMLPDAGHDLWSRDPAAYLGVLRPYLERVT
jgi:pimeloyl-ACP methyl ester carboxylesterase